MKLVRDGKMLIWMASAALLAAMLLLGGGQEKTGNEEEKRIAEVLSAIAGAGKVEVALFYAPQENGAFIQNGAQGAPTGAVVVAQGAENWQVRLQLIRAVRTLLGLPENAVDVFVMEEPNQ